MCIRDSSYRSNGYTSNRSQDNHNQNHNNNGNWRDNSRANTNANTNANANANGNSNGSNANANQQAAIRSVRADNQGDVHSNNGHNVNVDENGAHVTQWLYED